jgi:hypothetical protein
VVQIIKKIKNKKNIKKILKICGPLSPMREACYYRSSKFSLNDFALSMSFA